MKIVFGGSFDPVHIGHLRVATELSELCGNCEVSMIPCKLPVHKAETALSAGQRMSLLTAATAKDPCLTVDDRELLRESESYTYSTIKELHDEGHSVVLTVGTDAALGLANWYRSDEFSALCNLVVLRRPGYSDAELTNVLIALGFDVVEGVELLQSTACGSAALVSVTQLDISSSDIRGRVRSGKSVRHLVPDAVHQIICDNQLFKESSTCKVKPDKYAS